MVGSASARSPYAIRPLPADPVIPVDGPALTPAPITVDRITHNQGNLGTTIDNYGLIGGYSQYGLPSGEWPRNSGHHYLAEIKYWMGAVSADGDTLVANTDDDFQSLPSLISSQSENRILLSTDTTRYYDYDLADTTGAGMGNPAHGWRIYRAEDGGWVYTRNYDPLATAFFDGGPLSVQESHYRFGDHAEGSPLLGLEMTHTVLQWNYCYNEDFLFVILEITNASTEDYTDFAFGIYADFDIGGLDGTGENGRLGDLVAFDSTENLAWTYDEDGDDPAWGATGIMGTKYLETPDGIGMTSFRTGDWALVPDNDPDRYTLINSEQFDTSLPPTDQYYIQCTRGIDLEAGKTVRVVFALVAGADEAEFKENAGLAQQLYDNYFVGPEPPAVPSLTVSAGDERVYLSWDKAAQNGVDPLTQENDFAGYKLYRSDDRGRTWGKPIYNTGNDCLDLDYETIARYPALNPTDLVPQSFIDTDLINGVEYWYCIVAYDTGASVSGVDTLQTGFGVPGSSANTARVTPRTDPAGHYPAAGTVTHEYTGDGEASDGTIIPVVFAREQILGRQYRVVFQDTPEETYWHLINVTTGDTILADQARDSGEPDMYEVAEGLRVVVRNGDRQVSSMTQTGFADTDTTLVVARYYGPALPNLTGDDGDVFGDGHFRSDYELRYTGEANPAPSLYEYWYDDPTYSVPFECWNVTTNERVSLAVLDFEFDGTWDSYDLLCIIDYPYNPAVPFDTDAFPYYYSWLIGLDDEVYAPEVGDVLTIGGAPLNGPGDEFYFSPDGVNAGAAAADLSRIRVVPDPYYALAPEWEVIPGETNIQFQNLPDICTIRIYTMSGDLIRTLEHDNQSGTEEWNLQTEAQRLVASGIYIFHVESQYGDHLGRFAVVK
jgi:hypothetical protein